MNQKTGFTLKLRFTRKPTYFMNTKQHVDHRFKCVWLVRLNLKATLMCITSSWINTSYTTNLNIYTIIECSENYYSQKQDALYDSEYSRGVLPGSQVQIFTCDKIKRLLAQNTLVVTRSGWPWRKLTNTNY